MTRSLRDYYIAANFRLLNLSITLCLFSAASACSNEKNEFEERITSKSVAEIMVDAEFAITERNFRINNRLHIGKAISLRTESGFPDFEVILFCNLNYAKKMLELAPDFISYCPQRLAIRDVGQQRIITASLIPQNTSNQILNAVTGEINKLVTEIVDFAADDWQALEE
ncbi:MAG: hypothetical protein ACI9SC_000540 [Gammaproteobacteria bacterium]|jgi:uncharacterized protein (DUF302 family)